MHFYPFNPSAYYLSTGHWSEDRAAVEIEAGLVRDLAYRRLLDLYYGEEEPIPSKTRLVAIRIRMLKHEEIVASVLKEKFTLTDGFWTQDRAETEIAKYQRRAAAARENGKKGGRPKTAKTQPEPSKTKSVAGGLQLRTRTKKETPLPPTGESGGGFLRFWNAYPSSTRKAARLKCWTKWKARNLEPLADQIVAHVEAMKAGEQWTKEGGQYIPAPLVYLNEERWEAPTEAQAVAAAEGANWRRDRGTVERKGVEVGIGKWDQAAFENARPGGETFAAYEARVAAKVAELEGEPA